MDIAALLMPQLEAMLKRQGVDFKQIAENISKAVDDFHEMKEQLKRIELMLAANNEVKQ